MKSELVPIFRDLQKYFNEPEMERTGESALIRRFTSDSNRISPIRRFNIFFENSIRLSINEFRCGF
ncbi:MAG: hypothetical protein A2X08_01810 [Bacteroidetes bacterium GWA2_32_17]|nr:MAG: hypothetical protein A2X08_01810 [Bacteroidetes bacterium GWA2_32_17]